MYLPFSAYISRERGRSCTTHQNTKYTVGVCFFLPGSNYCEIMPSGREAEEAKKEEAVTLKCVVCMMENSDCLDGIKHFSPKQLPSLFKQITIPKAIEVFDEIPTPSPVSNSEFLKGPDGATTVDHTSPIGMPSPTLPQPLETHHHHSTISFSMPTAPSCLDSEQPQDFLFGDISGTNAFDGQPNRSVFHIVVSPPSPKNSMFHSQPLQAKLSQANTVEHCRSISMYSRPKDRHFDAYKTWSGKLERQLSNLRGKSQEPEMVDDTEAIKPEAIPAVDRYFESLEGPELETLKSSEELVLPGDKKWPFLLRFPVTSFGMCLGVSSQAILWKTLATSPSVHFLHVSLTINLILWCISLVLMGTVALIYSLKIIFYFEAVRREYYHPVRANFFFAPWIACLFLAIGAPPRVAMNLPAALWYVLMAPILCLELKVYGQWMSGGERRLSKVANPSNHLSVVGNFVGALLGASMGLEEGPIFFFAIGLAHYMVLFVTLYQRLPTTKTLPKELHPVYFFFVAVPSVVCIAWEKISGHFDFGARIAYFIALFLYISLVVRINFFRGFRFSLAWWAYTFPMTGASIATIRFSTEVNNWLTQSLSVALSAISTFAVSTVVLSTVLHAFVLHDLFPNDISIAIKEKSKSSNKHSQRRTSLEVED